MARSCASSPLPASPETKLSNPVVAGVAGVEAHLTWPEPPGRALPCDRARVRARRRPRAVACWFRPGRAVSRRAWDGRRSAARRRNARRCDDGRRAASNRDHRPPVRQEAAGLRLHPHQPPRAPPGLQPQARAGGPRRPALREGATRAYRRPLAGGAVPGARRGGAGRAARREGPARRDRR